MLKFVMRQSRRTPANPSADDRTINNSNPQPPTRYPNARFGKTIDIEMIFKSHLTHKRGADRLAKYRPLFDGSDPDGIMPLLQIWQVLTRAAKAAIGPYLPYGIFADWAALLTVEGVNDPQHQIADLQFRKTWERELNIEQRTILLGFLTQNGVSGSDYGRPLFNADPDGVMQILKSMSKG